MVIDLPEIQQPAPLQDEPPKIGQGEILQNDEIDKGTDTTRTANGDEVEVRSRDDLENVIRRLKNEVRDGKTTEGELQKVIKYGEETLVLTFNKKKGKKVEISIAAPGGYDHAVSTAKDAMRYIESEEYRPK
jgi:predicted PP-loop superfamily ATPase